MLVRGDVAGEVDVALPDRADRGAGEHRGAHRTRRRSRPRATGTCSALLIRDADGEREEAVDAAFVFIGAAPRTDWLEGVVARDERGFILAGADAKAAGWPLKRDPFLLETTVPGVFVAGDVRARSIKRVASAVGEGSMAVSLDPRVPGGMSVARRAASGIDLFDGLTDEQLDEWAAVDRDPRRRRRRAAARAGRLLAGPAAALRGHDQVHQTVDGRTEPMTRQLRADLDRRDRGDHREPAAAQRARRRPVPRGDHPARRSSSTLALRTRPCTSKVMHVIGPVMRGVNARESNRERLTSLGTMAAGLAHELNNPAAAARRAASDLVDAVEVINHALRAFVESGIERERRGEAAQRSSRRRSGCACVRGTLDALDASDAEDAMLDALEDRGIEDAWRFAEPLAAGRPRRGLGRPRAGHRRPGDREDAGVGGGLADGARAGDRARRVHRAHVRPRQGDQDLRLHGPRRRRAGRRPRGPREHAGDARPQAQAHADQGQARLRQDAAAADDARLRAQPGLDEPARQRDRRARRGRRDHDHDQRRQRLHQGRHRRRRARHPGGRALAHLRPVLHHQGPGQRHGHGAGHRAAHRRTAPPRLDLRSTPATAARPSTSGCPSME